MFCASIQNKVKCLKFWCKYCFGCFLFIGGDKVGSLADVEFKAAKIRDTKTKTNDNCVKNEPCLGH